MHSWFCIMVSSAGDPKFFLVLVRSIQCLAVLMIFFNLISEVYVIIIIIIFIFHLCFGLLSLWIANQQHYDKIVFLTCIMVFSVYWCCFCFRFVLLAHTACHRMMSEESRYLKSNFDCSQAEWNIGASPGGIWEWWMVSSVTMIAWYSTL